MLSLHECSRCHYIPKSQGLVEKPGESAGVSHLFLPSARQMDSGVNPPVACNVFRALSSTPSRL